MRIAGTAAMPSIFAAARRPWPAMTMSASSIRIGLTKPNAFKLSAISLIWRFECVRALQGWIGPKTLRRNGFNSIDGEFRTIRQDALLIDGARRPNPRERSGLRPRPIHLKGDGRQQ